MAPAIDTETEGEGGDAGAGSTESKINWRRIAAFEGNRLDGYVPTKGGLPLGHSGVTVATGVDLGAMTEAGLDTLDIPRALKGKLRPYLGLRGAAAEAKLKRAPLHLEQSEAEQLNTAVWKSQADALRRHYNAATGARRARFDDLPEPAQTVIASVKFQWGDIWRHKNPEVRKFWAAVVAQDWVEAQAVLRQWAPGTYRTRRNAEADYLAPLTRREERPAGDAGAGASGSALAAAPAAATVPIGSGARKFWNNS